MHSEFKVIVQQEQMYEKLIFFSAIDSVLALLKELDSLKRQFKKLFNLKKGYTHPLATSYFFHQ